LKDVENFSLLMKTHFGQSIIDTANYSQIRTWIVFLVDAGLSNVSINRKVASQSVL
jgi:integrase/recombinase XerC